MAGCNFCTAAVGAERGGARACPVAGVTGRKRTFLRAPFSNRWFGPAAGAEACGARVPGECPSPARSWARSLGAPGSSLAPLSGKEGPSPAGEGVAVCCYGDVDDTDVSCGRAGSSRGRGVPVPGSGEGWPGAPGTRRRLAAGLGLGGPVAPGVTDPPGITPDSDGGAQFPFLRPLSALPAPQTLCAPS